ncbi:MAG: HAD-IIIC family phosphatase [Candidatus Omnitrophica bacterium]|nr:HAD-IIIC family phosphatase [Candidatus Omnitrophota bacterium]MCB9747473.1 HAD-IIIC family phosphatase [Candidatus Omnitrophota bacterium]
MDQKKLQGLIISDFNADVLSGHLNNEASQPCIQAANAPFGQVIPILLDSENSAWESAGDFTVIWTQPESVSETFKRALQFENVSHADILQEVDQFAQTILNIRDKSKTIFIPIWTMPTHLRGFGLLNMQEGVGLTNILMKMNLALAEKFKDAKNIYLLDASNWIAQTGKRAFNQKLWAMAKMPFDHEIFKIAAQEIKTCLRAISGQARKLVVVDLDDTLWGGIVGDQGWQNLKLGGHDPLGESFVDFQKALQSLTNRGIILGIVSKNEESVALEAIKNHPEMILKLEDFAGWRINWQDKAQNIAELAAELNLGLQSVVFIDDNPVERARVQEALSEVLVPDWPADKMLYKQTLLNLNYFDTPQLSEEDAQRAKMYQQEQRRQSSKANVGSLEQWLETLDIQVVVEELNEKNLQRATQLLNKTNQMNLSTRRMTEEEFFYWAIQDDHHVWTFRVADKFGDYGLTGIISLVVEEGKGTIVDFILSCRVIGRKVEESMVAILMEYAQKIDLEAVTASYLPTAKNKPCLGFWKKSGFKYSDNDQNFCWIMDNKFPIPDSIKIIDKTSPLSLRSEKIIKASMKEEVIFAKGVKVFESPSHRQ